MATFAGLTVQYLVAFQNNAMDDPNLITTVATPPGTLGGNNVWTDITAFVMADTPSPGRGRQHALQQFEAGGIQVTLQNRDGRFTPGNTSGPYTPYVTIRKPFRKQTVWSSTTYIRFTGQVDSWGTSWPDAAQQQTVVHVSDALRMFNLADLTTGGYPAQIVANGPEGYWRLGDPVGSTSVADSSGNGHTGIANPYGGTITFGGTGALAANIGTSALIVSQSGYITQTQINFPTVIPANSGSVSLEFWFKGSDTTGSGDVNVTYAATGGNVYAWKFQVATTPFVRVFDNIAGAVIFAVADNYADGNWHYCVVTSVVGTGVTVYIDNVNLGTGGTSVTAGTPGAYPAVNSVTAAATSSGYSFQEVAFYDFAMSSGQVAADWNLAAFPQEGTGARIGRVLNAVGWSSTARAVDTGKSTVQANTSDLTTTSSLSHMQQVEATEGGALFMTVDGKVRFYARTSLQSASWTIANQAVFGDNTAGGDIPFQPAPTLAMDDIDLYNEASAQRTGGVTQVWPSGGMTTTSITDNGRNTWNPPATLIGISDSEVLAECQYVVAKYATAVNRLSAITIDVVSTANSFPSSIPALLLLDLLYQVTVERTIVPGGAATFTQTCDIELISENINAAAGTWTITFGMELSDPTWWVLGTSALGQTTALSW